MKYRGVMSEADNEHLDALIEQQRVLEQQKQEYTELGKNALKQAHVARDQGGTQKYKNTNQSLKTTLKTYEKALDPNATEADHTAAANAYRDHIRSFDDVANSAQKAADKIQEYKNATALSIEETGSLKENILTLANSMDQDTLEASELAQRLQEMGIELSDIKKGNFNLTELLNTPEFKATLDKLVAASKSAAADIKKNMEDAKDYHTQAYQGKPAQREQDQKNIQSKMR